MKAVCLVYCLSGFVSLGYQVAWFRIYVDRFGSTNLTFVLVLCNFIGGLGAGALASRWMADRLARTLHLRERLRVYGVVELLVAASALLTFAAGLIPADTWGVFPYTLRDGIYVQTPDYQLSKIAIATICVFLPCFFMGVTFPLLCHRFSGETGSAGERRFPALLYGWNTLGACAGVLCCQFILLPWVGHVLAFWFMAGLNLLIGAYFLAMGGRGYGPQIEATTDHVEDLPPAAGSAPKTTAGVLTTCAILSGLVAGALEGDAFKRIWFLGGTSSAAMSFISFWAILAIFAASWTVRALPTLRLNHIKAAFVLAVVLYALAWHFAYPMRAWLNASSPIPAYHWIGLWPLLTFVGIVVFPAYYFVGLLLPYICNRLHGDRHHLGLTYGVNTLAFCLGVVAFTWVAPRVNVFYSMKLALVLVAIIAVLLLTVSEYRRLWAWPFGTAAAAVVMACVLVTAGADRGFFMPGSPAAKYPIRAVKSNGAHTTYVVETPEGDSLYFDNHTMSGTSHRSQVYMRLMAHFPLLAHPNPQRALLVCFGVGNTCAAIASHGSIQRIDVVDLNDKVFETAPEFAASNDLVYLDPRIRFIHDDGRNFLNVTDQRYDLITSEPPPPMMAGVDRLYSQQYYEQVLAHLTPRGIMTQWLPTYQMPPGAVDLVVATFVRVFPHTLLFTGFGEEFILVGSGSPIDLARTEQRFDHDERVATDLRRLEITRPLELIARVVKGDEQLRRAYGGGRIISDARNDLANFSENLNEKAVITYDPVAMLRDIGADRLDMYDRLRGIVTHLGRLHDHIGSFPVGSLASVESTDPQTVLLADIDWQQLGEILQQYASAHSASDRVAMGRLLERALALTAQHPGVLHNLVHLHILAGEYQDAIESLRRYQAIETEDVHGYIDLGIVLKGLERYDEAAVALEHALRLAPDNTAAHVNLANVLGLQGKLEEAINYYRHAVRLNPESAVAYYNLGIALSSRDEHDEAIDCFSRVLRIDPGYVAAHHNLGVVLARTGRFGAALDHLGQAARLKPDWPAPLKEMAWILAARPEADFHDPREAIQVAERAATLTQNRGAAVLDAAAVAYAAADRFDQAIATARRALALATAAGQDELADAIRNRLDLYSNGSRYREPLGDGEKAGGED